MIPFLIDTIARIFILRNQLEWYEIPDLVTFLATYSCFCLAVMLMVNPHGIATDSEAGLNIELVRVRLLSHSLLFIALAAGISFFRAFDEVAPALHLYKTNAFAVVGVVCASATYSFLKICTTYLSYVNPN
jgi:hypothetical protein